MKTNRKTRRKSDKWRKKEKEELKIYMIKSGDKKKTVT